MPPGLPSDSPAAPACSSARSRWAASPPPLVQDHQVQLQAPAAGMSTPPDKLRTTGSSSSPDAATRTSTMGRSPEMPWGHRPGCPRRLAATASGA